MAADINDKLKKYKSRFSTTLSTGIGTGTSDTLTPATVTGLPTDTAVTLFIDRVDSTGTKTPSKLEAIKGVISGGNLTSYVRAVEGTEQAHSGGAVVEMVWNAADWNDMVDWGLEEHNQDGTHDTTKVVTPTDTQVLTNKTLTSPTLTSPVINTGVTGTALASASDVTTGTDDAKIVTPKGLKDAGIGVSPVKASGAEITTGTDDAKFVTAKALADATVGKLGAAWTAWTPVLTASTTNPNLGSTGTSTGTYIKIGKTVFWSACFQAGGTGISAGSGTYKITMPTTPKANAAGFSITGYGWSFNGNFHVLLVEGTNRIFCADDNAQMDNTSGNGGLFAAGHTISISGSYEDS